MGCQFTRIFPCSGAGGKDLILEFQPAALVPLGLDDVEHACGGKVGKRRIVVKYKDLAGPSPASTAVREEGGLVSLLPEARLAAPVERHDLRVPSAPEYGLHGHVIAGAVPH